MTRDEAVKIVSSAWGLRSVGAFEDKIVDALCRLGVLQLDREPPPESVCKTCGAQHDCGWPHRIHAEKLTLGPHFCRCDICTGAAE